MSVYALIISGKIIYAFGPLDSHRYIGNILISKIVVSLYLLRGHRMFIVIPGISLI